MAQQPPPILRALRDFHLGEQNRAKTVQDIAKVLDILTPFSLIPVLGGIIEDASDLIWPDVAEAIVKGFEKAKAKALAKKKAKA